jgi:hypothetical protein
MKMVRRVQALEAKAVPYEPRKIHLIGRSPHSTSEDAVAACKRDKPGTEGDEFIVMVGLLKLPDEESC